MSERITVPVTSEEVALDAAIRALLEADGWTAGQQIHLLDCALLVRRYGREAVK